MVTNRQMTEIMKRFERMFHGGIEPAFVGIYRERLGGKLSLEEIESGFKQSVIQGKMNPSPDWILQAVRSGHAENDAAYRIVSGSKTLPAAPEVEMDLTQAHFARTQVLAAVFKHQGDTQFYRDMLASNGGMYSRVLDSATGLKAAVTHQDVMDYLGESTLGGQNSPQQAASSPVKAVSSAQPVAVGSSGQFDESEWEEIE